MSFQKSLWVYLCMLHRIFCGCIFQWLSLNLCITVCMCLCVCVCLCICVWVSLWCNSTWCHVTSVVMWGWEQVVRLEVENLPARNYRTFHENKDRRRWRNIPHKDWVWHTDAHRNDQASEIFPNARKKKRWPALRCLNSAVWVKKSMVFRLNNEPSPFPIATVQPLPLLEYRFQNLLSCLFGTRSHIQCRLLFFFCLMSFMFIASYPASSLSMTDDEV